MDTELYAYLKYCWKAVIAFVSLLLTNVFTRLVTNGEALPETGHDWLLFCLTVVGGTWLVYVKGNGPKPEKAVTGQAEP